MSGAPHWPAELPQVPLVAGFSRGFADAVKVSQPSKGARMTRRQTVSAERRQAQTLALSWPQYHRLVRFHEVELEMGALPFWMSDAMADGRPLTTRGGQVLTTRDGRPLLIRRRCLMLFTAPPEVQQAAGPHVMVSLQMAVMP